MTSSSTSSPDRDDPSMTLRHAAESASKLTGRRVVVVDHHDSYTYNLVHLVAAVTGRLPEVVEHDETSLEELTGFSHIVLSPGPGNPDDERDFSVGRRVLLEATVPVLGVCLGMQGMVSVYGGVVRQIDPAHGEVAHRHPRRDRDLRRGALAVQRGALPLARRRGAAVRAAGQRVVRHGRRAGGDGGRAPGEARSGGCSSTPSRSSPSTARR